MSDMKANGSAQGKQKGIHAVFSARANPPPRAPQRKILTEAERANPPPRAPKRK